jgi:hypothetical protein
MREGVRYSLRMTTDRRERLAWAHSEGKTVEGLRIAILSSFGDEREFQQKVAGLVRQTFDEVIDSRRTGRRFVSELILAELEYLRCKFEVLLRSPTGPLGRNPPKLRVGLFEVNSGSMPSTARLALPFAVAHQPCVAVFADEVSSRFSFGLVARGSKRNPANGRASYADSGEVLWLLRASPYSGSFWANLSRNDFEGLTTPRLGVDRLEFLFRAFPEVIFTRAFLESLVGGRDALSRQTRSGCGLRRRLSRIVRDPSEKLGDRRRLSSFELVRVGPETFQSVRVSS